METSELNLDALEIEYDYNLSELEIKRNQVIKLSNELDKEKFTNHMLKQQLDTANNRVKELESLSEITNKSCKRLESEIENMQGTSTKNQMLAERMNIERSTLITNLQTSQLECIELKRNIENFHTKLNLIKLGEKLILQREIEIKSIFDDLKCKYQAVEKLNETVIQCKNLIATNPESSKIIQYYDNELKRTKCENKTLEKQTISLKAENDQLKELLKDKMSENYFKHHEILETVEAAYDKMKHEEMKGVELNEMLAEANEQIKNFTKVKYEY